MSRDWLVIARGELTHEEVADQVGIKRQYYSMIENGSRDPSVKVAKKIGMVLKIDWTLFFRDKGNEMLLDDSKPA